MTFEPRVDEEQLYGRLALLAGHLTPESFRKSLAGWAAGGAGGRFGQHLVDGGRIEAAADAEIQAEVDRHIRATNYLRRRQRDIALARLALEKGMASVGPLNEAIRAQARLEDEGRHLFLGQILVKRGLISAQQFLELNLALARLDLFCDACDLRFGREDVAGDGDPDEPPTCPECGEPLLFPDAPEPRLLSSDTGSGSDSGEGRLPRSGEYAARIDEEGVYQLVDLTIPREIGPYRVVEEIARGGMGIIYVGEDDAGQRVAIKVLKDGENAKDVELRRFHQEIQVTSRLSHESIVAVGHSGVHDGTPYYTMEFIVGRTLRSLLRERAIGTDDAIRILIDVARAVEYAHGQGVIHRDLKPSNILVEEESGRSLVTDFGLAKFRYISGATITRSGDTIGTPHYMPPEQISAKPGRVDHRADIYSLGAILYQILTDEPPFTGGRTYEILEKVKFERPIRPRKRKADVPDSLDRVCMRAIQKDPDHRYRSAGEMADDLERHLAGLPVQAGSESGGWRRVTSWLGRRRRDNG